MCSASISPLKSCGKKARSWLPHTCQLNPMTFGTSCWWWGCGQTSSWRSRFSVVAVSREVLRCQLCEFQGRRSPSGKLLQLVVATISSIDKILLQSWASVTLPCKLVVFQILVLLRRSVVPACSCRPVLVALLCGSCTQLWCCSLSCQTSAPGRIKVLCSNQTIILDSSNFTQSLKEWEKVKTWNIWVNSSLTVSFSSWPFSTRIRFPVWKSTDKQVCRQTPRNALIILRLPHSTKRIPRQI